MSVCSELVIELVPRASTVNISDPCQNSRVLAANQSPQWTAAGQPAHIRSIWDEATLRLPAVVLLLGEASEAELVGDVHFLATGKLELGTTQSFDCNVDLLILGADGDQDLADIHSGSRAVRLAESPAHPT